MLGPGNESEAREALQAYPGGLQIGGGVNLDNSRAWLDAGASHVIVTSWVFRGGQVDWDRLAQLPERSARSGSCWTWLPPARHDYLVVTDRWQKFTDLALSRESLEKLARGCAEFLVHAVDVEGQCRGIDQELVSRLAEWSPIPATYAGGASSLADLETVTRLGRGGLI